MKYLDSYQGSEVSFWDTFPVFKETGLFKKLYKEDRSKDKNKSSKVMWYCVLVKDIDSEFYTADKQTREQDENLFDVLDLDVVKYMDSQEELDLLLNYFEDFISCVIAKSIRKLEKKLIERDLFIEKSKYSFDEHILDEETGKYKLLKGNSAQLDKMVTDGGELYDQIKKMRENLKSEQGGKGKGGREKSLIE